MSKPSVATEAKSIMAELNPTVCGEVVKSLLESPQASRGLVKLLLSISAVQAMSGVTKPGDPDSFIDAAVMVVELRKAYEDAQKQKGKK